MDTICIRISWTGTNWPLITGGRERTDSKDMRYQHKTHLNSVFPFIDFKWVWSHYNGSSDVVCDSRMWMRAYRRAREGRRYSTLLHFYLLIVKFQIGIKRKAVSSQLLSMSILMRGWNIFLQTPFSFKVTKINILTKKYNVKESPENNDLTAVPLSST